MVSGTDNGQAPAAHDHRRPHTDRLENTEPTGAPAPSFVGWSNASPIRPRHSLLPNSMNIQFYHVDADTHLNTVKAFPDAATPENGFWQVETSSLRDFPQQFYVRDRPQPGLYDFRRNDRCRPAVKAGSPADKSRSYGIMANQVIGAETKQSLRRVGHRGLLQCRARQEIEFRHGEQAEDTLPTSAIKVIFCGVFRFTGYLSNV